MHAPTDEWFNTTHTYNIPHGPKEMSMRSLLSDFKWQKKNIRTGWPHECMGKTVSGHALPYSFFRRCINLLVAYSKQSSIESKTIIIIFWHACSLYTVKKNFVKSVAVSECHWKFLVTVTIMCNDDHYLPQISLPFHQVFLTVYYHQVHQ